MKRQRIQNGVAEELLVRGGGGGGGGGGRGVGVDGEGAFGNTRQKLGWREKRTGRPQEAGRQEWVAQSIEMWGCFALMPG